MDNPKRTKGTAFAFTFMRVAAIGAPASVLHVPSAGAEVNCNYRPFLFLFWTISYS
jgi:hypothetical protein